MSQWVLIRRLRVGHGLACQQDGAYGAARRSSAPLGVDKALSSLMEEGSAQWLPADQIERLPHSPAPAEVIPGYLDDKPVFVGHYWMTGSPQRLTKHVACLDYSIAAKKPGKLVAYRWQGESVLSNDHFEYVEG